MTRAKLPIKIPLLVTVLLSACLDVSPMAPGGPGDAGLSDAQASDGAASECPSCITDDAQSCPTYHECAKDSQCLGFINCVFERGCLDFPEWDQRVDCAVPCTSFIDNPTFNHPIIQMGIQINLCALEGCKHVCAGSSRE